MTRYVSRESRLKWYRMHRGMIRNLYLDIWELILM